MTWFKPFLVTMLLLLAFPLLAYAQSDQQTSQSAMEQPEAATSSAPSDTAPAPAAATAETEKAVAEPAAAEPVNAMVEQPDEAEEALAETLADAEVAKMKSETPKAPGFDWREFIDTKLSISYADDNMLENNEFSPSFGIGQQNTSDFTGGTGELHPNEINHTHLVVHHKGEGYLPGIMTEAAMVLKLSVTTDPTSGSADTGISDDGSFLRFGYIFKQGTDEEMMLDVTGFPFDAERFLLGFHYDLSWGGEASFPQNSDSVPGVRLGFTHPRFYFFAGMKTHLQPKKDKLNTERVPTERVYAGLFGAGVTLYDGLMLEANGGVFEKGDNPNMPEVTGEGGRDDILSGGISTRLSYSYGIPIGDRMDLRLYQNDPRKILELVRNDEYEPGRFSAMVSAEYAFLTQNLQNPDKPDGTKAFNAMAAHVGLKLKYDYLRIHLEGAYRSLEFLLFNTPGYVPFQAFPDSAKTRPELYGVISMDYYIKQAYLTLGLTAGYKIPATYQGDEGVPISVVKRPTATTAYISPFNRAIEILPDGKDAFDIIEAKFDAEFDLSDFMTFLLEVSYTLDNNRVKLATSPNNSETLYKKFEDDNVTNRLGLAIVVQAAF